MNTDQVVEEFRNNLGPLEAKRLPGNIQVNRRWYDGKLGFIELCVTTYYRGEHITEIGIYWQPSEDEIIPDQVDKFIWLEPEIQDIIDVMKVEFTVEELLMNSAQKLGFYKALQDEAQSDV